MKRMLGIAGVSLAVLTLAAGSSVTAETQPVQITRVSYNAVGADRWTNRWQESITIRNTSGGELDISGWTLHDAYRNPQGEHTNAFVFPSGTKVRPDGYVVVTPAACPNQTDPAKTMRFCMNFKKGYNGHFLNNKGDVVTVKNAEGETVAQLSYDFSNGYYVR